MNRNRKRIVASLKLKKKVTEALTKGRGLKTNRYSLRCGQDNCKRLAKERKQTLKLRRIPHITNV